MNEGWLSSAELADLAGVTRQVSNRTLAKALNEHAKWRGASLVVRTVQGRGGRSGLSYEVKTSSLPPELKARLKAGSTAVQLSLPLPAPSAGSAEMLWWLHHLEPIRRHPAGSTERAAAVAALDGTIQLDWKTRKRRMTHSVIYKKLGDLERHETMSALARRKRKDRGVSRTFVSRPWDQAVPFDDATKAKIAENLAQQIRALRSKKANRKWVLTLAREWLKSDTGAHGFRPKDPVEFDRICSIPVKLYTQEAKYEAIYDYEKDRDRFDNRQPRVRRTIAGLRPMQIVVMDVHPIDVIINRQDGTAGSASLIAFMDLATRRVWCEFLFVEGKGGVRNTDVVKAFIGMAKDPLWGLPEYLYCDNGSEYLFADYLDDALQLNGLGAIDGERTSRVIRAIPYNASAKPVEGWFHRFESDHLRHIQGWHGGKLGAPKRPARGKLPTAYQHGFEAFCAEIMGHLKAYEAVPQFGELKGKSPNQVLTDYVATGWAATVIDERDLLTVFTKTETRVVKQHGISVGGDSWDCPELDTYFDKTVTVKIPVLGFGSNELWIGDAAGKFIGIATRSELRTFTDTRNAQHSADRKKRAASTVRAMRRSLPDVDAGAAIVAFGAQQTRPEPNAPHGTISVTSGMPAARAIIPAQGKSPDQTAEQAFRAARTASLLETEKLWKERQAR